MAQKIKSPLDVVADNKPKKPTVTILGRTYQKYPQSRDITSSPANEFSALQQQTQAIGGKPTSSKPLKTPMLREGAISPVLFGKAGPKTQKKILPDNVAVITSSTSAEPAFVGDPTVQEMREALTVLQGIVDPGSDYVLQKNALGIKDDFPLEKAQAIVLAGARKFLGLAPKDLRYGLSKKQIKLSLKLLDPDASPDQKPQIEDIKAAGEPKKSESVAPITSPVGSGIPIPTGPDSVVQFIAFVEEIFEPEEPRGPTQLEQLQKLMQQTQLNEMYQVLPDQGAFGRLNTLFETSRGAFPGQGSFGSQMWQAAQRFSGFGAPTAATATGASAAATGASAATGTAAAGGAAAAGAGAVTIGGITISAGAVVGIVAVVVLLLVSIVTLLNLKQLDLAEFIPIDGTGGGGSTSGSFGPTYDFEGVCWPVAGGLTRISETPEGHAARGELSTNGSAIDIAAATGRPVNSSVDGVVEFAAEAGQPHPPPYYPEYGGLVVILVDPKLVNGRENVKVYYAHLSSIENGLKAGDLITAGMPIGRVGSTGNSSGAHLHMEAINMSIYSLIPSWQQIYQDAYIPVHCEGDTP